MSPLCKLTEELEARMCAEISEGMPIEYACDLVGITRSSYQHWMARGEADANEGVDSPFASFFMAIKKSYAEFVKKSMVRIRAGQVGWQGAAWWLERTNAKFMPKQQIQADEDGKVTVVIGGKPQNKNPGNVRKGDA